MPPDLVEDMFPERGVGFLIGDSQVGKTFVVVDVGSHLETGTDWMGKKVKRCGVIHIAAEAPWSLPLRREALARAKGPQFSRTAMRNYAVVEGPQNLLDDKARAELIEDMKAAAASMTIDLGLIVLDVVSTEFGALTKPEEGQKIVAVLREIADEMKCFVLGVHHNNRTGTFLGSVNLRNLCDCMILAKADTDEDGQVTGRHLVVDKLRDGATGLRIDFCLEVVPDIGRKGDKPLSSCVVRQVSTDEAKAAKAAKKGSRPPPKHEETFMDAVDTAMQASGIERRIAGGSGPPVRCVRVEAVRSIFYDRVVTGEEGDPEKDSAARRQALRRELKRATEQNRRLGQETDRDKQQWLWFVTREPAR
jgi:hypothetical protein